MNEVYEALSKMKAVARDKGWFAYKEGTPENEAYHQATKALNKYPPTIAIDMKASDTVFAEKIEVTKPKPKGKKK